MSDRRSFLKHAMTGSAAITASSLIPRRIFGEQRDFYRLSYRNLGSTGAIVTEVGMGCMNMRDPELVNAAIDFGINYIDTAHAYMNGKNEEVVGQVMKTRRKEVFLTTKVKPAGGAEIRNMIETSLKRLNTDHVDLMLLHNLKSDEPVLKDETIRAFELAKRDGLIRFAGVSTHQNQAEVIDAAIGTGFWEAVLVGYNYFSPKTVGEAIKRARIAGLATIGMKNILNPTVWPWETLDDIRKDKNSPATPAQALLKWVLEDMYIDTIIPGITSFEQLRDDVAVMGMKIELSERRKLHRFGNAINSHYCRGVAGCTECLHQCPNGVCLSDLNRCIAYANSYGDKRLAAENYDGLPKSSRIDQCSDCDECTVVCPNGIDTSRTVREARSLFG